MLPEPRAEPGHGQEGHGHHGLRQPQGGGHAARAGLQVALGAGGQPQGAMHGEDHHEEHAAQQAIGVQQREQVAVEEPRGVQGQALEDVGEGHAQQQRGQEGAHHQAGIPGGAPAGAVDLAAELEGHAAQDQREEQQHQRRVEAREHDGVGPGEGREGHAARGDEPHLVAVPEGAHGVHEDALVGLAFREEGEQRAQAQVEAVEHEVHGPGHAPDHEPDGFQHGRLPHFAAAVAASGPLRANVNSR